MTLLDFVKQFVRVHNIDEDWYYYETGDYPELFEKNWNYQMKWLGPEELDYYTKKDFKTVEEALGEDEPEDLLQMLIEIAWATNQDIDLNELAKDEWDDMWKDYAKYEICIGDDYETEVERDIDMT